MVSIQKDVSLKNFSNYKIGGKAKYFLKVSSISELREGLAEWEGIQRKDSSSRQTGRKVFILGAGTNTLISDRGFDGLVIYNRIKEIESQRVKESESQRARVRVGAGALMKDLLNFCIKNSLSGPEWAGGLPGTLGGAIRGNAGAFKGEIKNNIIEVTSLDIKTLKIKKRKLKDCRFGYRSSIFKSQRVKGSDPTRQKAGAGEIIILAVLKLQKGDKDLIKKKIEEKINYRKERHPLEYPNIGSIFKNIPIEKVPQKLLKELRGSIKDDPFPILPTAKLLALAGLKGEQAGGAMVSQKHPNFIVNFNNASSTDVKNLIYKIKKIIKDKYEVDLEEEITII